MAKYFYHPYGENAPNASPYTRSGHGCGKLDINGNHTPFYAMCDGKIVGVGTWSDGNFYCVQECNNSALGLTFYIRYLHGDYVVNTGDYVNTGDLLGYTTTNNGMYNDHLHIDFSWTSNSFDPVAGSFNSEKTIYTVKNKKMKIKSGIIDWNKLNEWKNTNGGSAYGYCWLVFAQTPKYIEKQTGSNIEITEELITQIKEKLLQYEGQHWSTAQVKAIINCYNAIINTGLVNHKAAIAIVANGMYENLSGCTGGYSHPDYADWGFGNDGINSGTDCGIWAFHSGGNAFNDKVVPNIKPYVLSCGFSEDEFNKGNYDVQGQYISGICANKNSKYKLAVHSNGVAITSPKTGQSICATTALQQKYVNNFNQYFEDGNDIGQGALLFERLFENSAQYETSLKRRAGAAYALDECLL